MRIEQVAPETDRYLQRFESPRITERHGDKTAAR